MLSDLERNFRAALPAADQVSLRFMRTRDEVLHVRQDILQPVTSSEDVGAMVTVVDGGGQGHAATSDLSAAGLREAVERARDWARRTAGLAVVDFREIPPAEGDASYETPARIPWASVPLKEMPQGSLVGFP